MPAYEGTLNDVRMRYAKYMADPDWWVLLVPVCEQAKYAIEFLSRQYTPGPYPAEVNPNIAVDILVQPHAATMLVYLSRKVFPAPALLDAYGIDAPAEMVERDYPHIAPCFNPGDAEQIMDALAVIRGT